MSIKTKDIFLNTMKDFVGWLDKQDLSDNRYHISKEGILDAVVGINTIYTSVWKEYEQSIERRRGDGDCC